MNKQNKQFLNKTNMKKVALIVVMMCSILFANAQSVFDKFESKEGVSTVVVSKKMFEMMSKIKVDSKDKETQTYMSLLKNLDNLKVFATDNTAIATEMKNSFASYLKTNPLEELMRASNEGRKVNIYVKSGSSENIVKELLMLIDAPNEKENKSVILSLTGNFNLDDISMLTEKLSIPGGEELKKASKKK